MLNNVPTATRLELNLYAVTAKQQGTAVENVRGTIGRKTIKRYALPLSKRDF